MWLDPPLTPPTPLKDREDSIEVAASLAGPVSEDDATFRWTNRFGLGEESILPM